LGLEGRVRKFYKKGCFLTLITDVSDLLWALLRALNFNFKKLKGKNIEL
jgi:hypothetical protein